MVKVQYILIEAEEVLFIFCEMCYHTIVARAVYVANVKCDVLERGIAVVTNCFDGKGLDVRSEI